MSITENSTAWIPETTGDSVTGKVTGLSYVDHDGGGKYEARRVLVVTIDDAGTSRAIWSWHTVLSRRLHELKPAVGETLTVSYHGRIQSKTAAGSYASYTATIAERPDDEFVWADEPSGAGVPAAAQAELSADDTEPDDDDDDGVPF